ncbi:alkaline phosphatase family protein [Pseudoalteromonas fenneropenaei]|uniref:Alkaline phosphatase family protein n=1 Tax=Pseudoalteromonas fenneropenaei TaxID=1737459 RepID=A0ABV7CGL8_9GAMM
MKKLLATLLLLGSACAHAEQNLILVTIDGVRWQEVFRGIDPVLLENPTATQHQAPLRKQFWRDSQVERQAALMPFLWQTVAKQGVLIGDRDQGSLMRVANPWYFSYPGYNEIITGKADASIDSNDKVPNHNVSFIEWLATQPGFSHNLAVFASWDVFPAIFNRERSKLHINAGFENAAASNTQLRLLNELQTQIPSPWDSVRLDAFTFHYAKQYLLTNKPRVLMLALGEPDDFAHEGNYDEYIKGIHRADALLSQLWQTVQGLPEYRDNTTLLITTDHGRGQTASDWQHHSSQAALAKKSPDSLAKAPNGIVGSEQVWFAAIGPSIKAKGILHTKQEQTASQIAATALELLGENPKAYRSDIDPALSGVLHD